MQHDDFPTAGRVPLVGAEPAPDGTRFRVWAPDHDLMSLHREADGRLIPMAPEPGGWFFVRLPGAGAGMQYRFAPGDGSGPLLPDPASRFQREGPHGPSEVVDARAFRWTDGTWRGVRPGRQVICEMHIGTFTTDGTWRAAADRLHELADVGITMLEVMPVSEFPGRFNWGYDGVALFAPSHVHGTPDDMRSFVDRAHELGLAVILDVVYNHMGPDGCYMGSYARDYFSTRYTTDWGDAINFDGPRSRHVRDFFLANVEYWIRDFHIDGFRFDATQNIYDASEPHILAELAAHARATAAAAGRRIWLIAENEPQDTTLVRPPARDGYGFDAIWNDDFHHSAVVALTGRTEAYYSDHRGTPQEFVSAAKWGFLFQGQHYRWQHKRRGSPALDVEAWRFVNFLENHDQVANTADGRRLCDISAAGEYRALTALLLLMPGTAMLFQGQEYGSTQPFLFFADHEPELAAKVHEGRRSFMKQFPSAGTQVVQETLPDPADPATFERCRLDRGEREQNRATLDLHRDLIRLSREDPVLSVQDARRVHGAVLTDEAFVLRWLGESDDRILLVNLGTGRHFDPAPEPLLAPPAGMMWKVIWSSEDPRYGGRGSVEAEQPDGWQLPGRAAVVLAPVARAGDEGDDEDDVDPDGEDEAQP